MSTIAVLMLLPSLTSARYYRVPGRFRVRYSPYAFSYKHPSGLISGELEYCPYAFSYKNPSGLVPYYLHYSPYAFSCKNPSGLVPYYFRYSPYAFSYKHPSGLISDYCSYYYFTYDYCPCAYNCKCSDLVVCNTNCCPYACSHNNPDRPNYTKDYYRENANAQRQRAISRAAYRNKMKAIREKDGMQIIYSYFKSNNIDDFEMDRLFKVDNKTVSVNFVFRDKNIVIKYWNPEEIKSLMQQSGYKKTYCEQYQQQWKDFCQKHEEKGGRVYQIESADKEEILSKLSLCRELSWDPALREP